MTHRKIIGKINRVDNSPLYYHLTYHYIDCFQVCILDMIHVDNNDEHQLEELLRRKDRKCIWDLGSIAQNGLSQDDEFYSQEKTVDFHIFIYIIALLYYKAVFCFMW